MEASDITLGKVRHKSNLDESTFVDVYERLITGERDLSEEEKFFLLKVAVYFLNSEDKEIKQLGYSIVLRYSNKYRDYQPLYDVALNQEYIPVTKFIERKYPEISSREVNFSKLYLSAYQENFKLDGSEDKIYRSRGQMILNKFSGLEDNIAVVAPTSYGKSEMIIKKIEGYLDKKVCIIVPSKALLSQTKKILLKNETIKDGFKRIITHPDMYKATDTAFLAVLTQERLLRLLQKNKNLSIDLVMVDEAHNLLEKEERARLLAQVLLILKNRDNNFLTNFFTPFLMDVGNLSVLNHDVEIKGKPIKENMKVERFYAYDSIIKSLSIYDQFLNKVFPLAVQDYGSDIEFILGNKAAKSIVYLNRPVHAEQVAAKMAILEPEIEITEDIKKVIDSMADLIHPDYNLIKCIRHGILYHHGGVPDAIRLYIEDIFSKYPEFKIMVTTSTLLEGVNIPAEKIFLLTPQKSPGYLSASQFKNLIGRVCRFKEVFNPETGDLRMLEPSIYLIKGDYTRDDFALLKFYIDNVSVSKKIKDDVRNPLLANSTNLTDRQEVLEYLENMEPGSSGLTDITQPESTIGRLCFENNVYDFNIISSEETLITNLATYNDQFVSKVNTPELLMGAISEIFFVNIILNPKSENILRLQEEKAKNFYIMFINWRTKGSPYPMMINNFLRYWEAKEREGDPLIFVGSKWGDIARDGIKRLFVNISQKTADQRINLAIARTKEEQEFVDFNILKYIEILNELELMDQDFFDQVKYGTSDRRIICMLKNGFSMDLSRLLRDKYLERIEFNFELDVLNYDQSLVDLLNENNENEILIFEAMSNL